MNTELDITNVSPFMTSNVFGIFLLNNKRCKIDLFISANDLEHKYTEPNKV